MTTTRRTIQAFFVALTLIAVFVVGANAERWCPFGGVEAIYTYVREGNMLCSLGVSNLYILGGVLLLTLLLRRAFCGYVCPIGALSEWLQRGARRCGVKPLRVPYRLDRALALLKYLVIGIVLLLTYRAAELMFRGFDPCYALISRHGEDITLWAYVVAGAVVFASLLIVMPFCRWLCPLAAVLHPFSRFGLTRIRRDEQACISCAKCSKACPMSIRVGEMSEVNAARCLSCMQCIEACPPRTGGALSWGPPKRLGRAWPNAVLVGLLVLILSGAVLASYAWPLPSFVQVREKPLKEPATIELRVDELTCRGRGTLLWYFLDRDDEFAIEGGLRLEAWPGPGTSRVRVHFDAGVADADAVRMAIVQPYYDMVADVWRMSPFRLAGEDPLAP